jgi:regulatory protein
MSDSCDKPFHKARNSALRILAQREHSVAELTQKLSRRGHAGDVVQRVIAECLSLNYLDDQRAVHQVLAWMKRKGFGIHRVRSELLKKGLAGPEAEDDLRESMSPAEEHLVAQRVALKKRERLQHDPDPIKRKLRLQRFLRSRGFSDSVVHDVLAALDREQDADHPANN